MKNLEILYEDETCLAVNKPAGLPVQGGKNAPVSVDALLRTAFPGGLRPLLVHRLDKDTSGVLLTAKGGRNAAFYSALIASRAVKKRYTAVCSGAAGVYLKNEGVITFAVDVHGKQKAARTHYTITKRGETETGVPFLVFELELGTGRTHQIRIHLQKSGAPILGDGKYGDFRLNKELRKTPGLRRMLLHANALIFTTKNGAALEIKAPQPPEFQPWTS
ncbi:MAG: RluA family pseudouridine synthase [Spirochaetaceae bacterium]|jgi:23S rRNA pseudouridine955/2504/2580 synthase|nr:RluA family pseudouridine synthase [Spirochaetaceae bacterium]